MAEPSDKPEQGAEDRGPSAGSSANRPAPNQQQRQLQVDDSRAVAAYANFFRVAGTPEELIIDWGLNPLPLGAPNQQIRVNQRIILSFYTAKRLLQTLHVAVQRHEAAFGVLETDVQKRVKPGTVAQPPGQPPRPPA